MSGFIHRQVSHDPDRKILLPKGTQFKGVKIKSCLYKEYPSTGPYAGGHRHPDPCSICPTQRHPHPRPPSFTLSHQEASYSDGILE